MRVLATIGVLLFAVACSPSGQPGPSDGSNPTAVVRDIYDPFLNNGPGRALSDLPLTDELAALVSENAELDVATEVPWLGFDPIIEGQEAVITDLDVGEAEQQADGSQRVTVSFRNMGETKVLEYDLVQVGGEWRVRELRSADWELSEILQQAIDVARAHQQCLARGFDHDTCTSYEFQMCVQDSSDDLSCIPNR